eukprot:1683538-Rhodomonas_salina.1
MYSFVSSEDMPQKVLGEGALPVTTDVCHDRNFAARVPGTQSSPPTTNRRHMLRINTSRHIPSAERDGCLPSTSLMMMVLYLLMMTLLIVY